MHNFLKNQFLLLLLLVASLGESFAQSYSQVYPTGSSNRVSGIVLTNPLIVSDAGISSLFPLGAGATKLDRQQKMSLSFMFDTNKDTCHTDTVAVVYRIAAEFSISQDGVTYGTSSVRNFDISYSPSEHEIINEKATFHYANAYSLKITSITVNKVFPNGLAVQLLSSQIPADIIYEVRFDAERYSKMNAQLTTPPRCTLALDNNRNEVVFNYTSAIGGKEAEYELEWAFVSDYNPNGLLTAALPPGLLKVAFENNATRVRLPYTPGAQFKIPNLFDRGYVVARVRAIGRNENNLDLDVYSAWSACDGFNQRISLSSLPSTNYISTLCHDCNKNWILSSVFAEDGKAKHVANYADGTTRTRQTVTLLSTENVAMATETMYDYSGRGVVQVLPAPTGESKIKYYNNFNVAVNGTKYSFDQFDRVGSGTCPAIPGELGTQSGAGKYYSPLNNLLQANNPTAPMNYVPDGEGFPFSIVRYTPDATGRVLESGQVGEQLTMGSGHSSKMYYGKPEQVELDRLFGTNVGQSTFYNKTMTTDPNGQTSVAYYDMRGNVIATSLAGVLPGTLEPVTDEKLNSLTNNTGTPVIVDLLNVTLLDPNGTDNSKTSDSMAMVVARNIMVSSAQQYSFNYQALLKEFRYGCNNFCFDCVYDLEISLLDECGVQVIPNGPLTRRIGGSQAIWDTLCNTPNFDTTFVVSLVKGTYQLKKTFKLVPEAIEYYAQKYLEGDTCILTIEDFKKTPEVWLCHQTCESCEHMLDSIGSRASYITAHLPAGLTSGTPEYDEVVASLGAQYDALAGFCEDLCNNPGPDFCDAGYRMMLTDMQPGGQYAKYMDPTNGTFNVGVHSFSLLNPATSLPPRHVQTYEGSVGGNLPNPSLLNNNRLYSSDTIDINYPTHYIHWVRFVFGGWTPRTGYVDSVVEASWKNPWIFDEQTNKWKFGYYKEDGTREAIIITDDGNGGYIPAVTNVNAVTPTSPAGMFLTYPENLARVEDFVNRYMGRTHWAKSLVVYHPEYLHYDWCKTNTYHKALVDTKQKNTYQYDEWLMGLNYQQAQQFFGANGYNLALLDPITGHNISLSNKRYHDYDGRIQYEMDNFSNENAPTPVYPEPANTLNIWQVAHYVANTGNSSVVPPFIVANKNNHSALINNDRVWKALVTNYIGMKQKRLLRFMEEHAARTRTEANCRCIGQNSTPSGAGNQGRRTGGPSPNGKGGGPSWGWPGIYNRLNPCNHYLWNKWSGDTYVRRFAVPEVGLVSNGYDLSSPDGVAAAQLYADQAYLQETGKCPVVRDLYGFINGLTTYRQLIPTSPIDMTNGSYATQKLYEMMLGTGSQLVYNPVLSTNGKTLVWQQSATSQGLGCPLTLMFQPGTPSYARLDAVAAFSEPKDIAESNGLFSFTMKAYMAAPHQGEFFEVKGSTCLDLQNCSDLLNQRLCRVSDASKDFVALMLAMQSATKLEPAPPVTTPPSTTPVPGIIPLSSPTLPSSIGAYLTPALVGSIGGSTNVADYDWVYIYDYSQNPKKGIYALQVSNQSSSSYGLVVALEVVFPTAVTSLNTMDLTDVVAFNSIVSAPTSNESKITLVGYPMEDNSLPPPIPPALPPTPASFEDPFTHTQPVFRMEADFGISSNGFFATDCATAVPVSCNTAEHNNLTRLRQDLSARVTAHATPCHDSTSITIVTMADGSTSTIMDTSFCDDCIRNVVKVSTGQPIDFNNVSSINNIVAYFDQRSNGISTHWFEANAVMNTGPNATIRGYYCLPMRNCAPCEEPVDSCDLDSTRTVVFEFNKLFLGQTNLYGASITGTIYLEVGNGCLRYPLVSRYYPAGVSNLFNVYFDLLNNPNGLPNYPVRISHTYRPVGSVNDFAQSYTFPRSLMDSCQCGDTSEVRLVYESPGVRWKVNTNTVTLSTANCACVTPTVDSFPCIEYMRVSRLRDAALASADNQYYSGVQVCVWNINDTLNLRDTLASVGASHARLLDSIALIFDPVLDSLDSLCGDLPQVPLEVNRCHGEATPTPQIEAENPCHQNLEDISWHNARILYERYITAMKFKFVRNYKRHCLDKVKEVFTDRYNLMEYHFMLYEYDLTGNLLRTIPPRAVRPITNGNDLNDVSNSRVLNTLVNQGEPNLNPASSPRIKIFLDGYYVEAPKVLLPMHDRPGATEPVTQTQTNYGGAAPEPWKLTTDYRYNSLNAVYAQRTPDAGVSRFWFDEMNRGVLSQDANQGSGQGINFMTCGYTLYDEFGRAFEGGKAVLSNSALTTSTLGLANATNTYVAFASPYRQWVKYTNLATAITQTAAVVTEMVATIYDRAPGLYYGRLTTANQLNLRKRVAATFYYDNKRINNTGYTPTGAPKAGYNSEFIRTATYYSYDIHGNVKQLWQQNSDPKLYGGPSCLSNTCVHNKIKTMLYYYDLISGKVNGVAYQPGMVDQFFHKYEYDADNRLTNVYTTKGFYFASAGFTAQGFPSATHTPQLLYSSKWMHRTFPLATHDGWGWERDAKYVYHLHGPLARTEYGDLRVQGLDHLHTLQGWTRGLNSESLSMNTDPGMDGAKNNTNPNARVARDVAGYNIRYYQGDYNAIGTRHDHDATINPNGGYLSSPRNLYNGNIMAMGTTLRVPGALKSVMPLAREFSYDQLNRIISATAFDDLNLKTNQWRGGATQYKFNEGPFQYDPNGNILNMKSRFNGNGTVIDSFKYHYVANTNMLAHVKDAVGSSVVSGDLDNQNNGNYTYDRIGNLISDASEGISNIEWSLRGKVRSVTRSSSNLINLSYVYGPDGQRVSKYSSSVATGVTEATWYVRDAQGNVMATYYAPSVPATGTISSLVLKEQHIYGSSRIGMVQRDLTINMSSNSGSGWTTLGNTPTIIPTTRGQKRYELSNHLGNVLAVITDRRKEACDANNRYVLYYDAALQKTADYYVFGMEMAERNLSVLGRGYRYGFNTQESSPEVQDNHYTALFWEYDARSGRRWNIDPVNQPWQSPYATFDGDPISKNDILGNSPEWTPTIAEQTKKDNNGNSVKSGFLAAKIEKGDNAESLAKFLGVSTEEGQKLFETLQNGTVKVPDAIARPINDAINDTYNPSGSDYTDDSWIPDALEENYNCWESTLSISKGATPNFGNIVKFGIDFVVPLLSEYENVSENPGLYQFGRTAIRFAEDKDRFWGLSSYNETTHGANYLGTSRDGTIYTWTKNGKLTAPQIMKLNEVISIYGKVQGAGITKNEGGYYNYIGK